ncbi:MAG: hypothetical protein ACKO2P_04925 [Planctomycetota bacterium]
MEKLVIFFIIFVISQLVNLFSKSGNQNAPPAPRQVGPAKSGTPPKSQQTRRPQSPQTKPTRNANAPRNAPAQDAANPRRSRDTAAQNPSTRPSGAAVRDHVNAHLEPRIGTGVQQHIDQHVQAHIGSNAAATNTPTHEDPAFQTGTSIRQLLKNPAGVRQAILVNEILARPRALR